MAIYNISNKVRCEEHVCLRYGHGVKDDDKVIHCLRAGLSDSVVRFNIDHILRALQTQIGTDL